MAMRAAGSSGRNFAASARFRRRLRVHDRAAVVARWQGGYGARWLRAVARLPIHIVPADAQGWIAAVDVRDVGEAIAVLCEDAATASRDVELGGSLTRTLRELLAALRRVHVAAPPRCLRLPAPLARLASHLCDALHVSPFSFGHLELLRRDNRPAVNLLPALRGGRRDR